VSRDASLMCGLALVLVPTIVYGGLTLLGLLTGGAYGAPSPRGLSSVQGSLYRAGHAHAGVLTILGLALQMLLDHSLLPSPIVGAARVGALTAPVFVAAGFFGTAHLPRLRVFVYIGAATVAATTLTVAFGLLRASG
jgi:hypothetical protein